MILDSSAIVAVMLAEPEYEEIRERIGAAEVLGVGAPTVVESDANTSTRPWMHSYDSAREGIPQA